MTSSVQPSPAWRRAVDGVRLDGPGRRGADGDDPAALGVGLVDEAGGRLGHPVALGVRRLVRLEGRHAGVERDGREHHAALRRARRTSSGVNGRPADGISAEPRPEVAGRRRGEHGLVVGDRPGGVGAAVADRPAVLGEERGERHRRDARRPATAGQPANGSTSTGAQAADRRRRAGSPWPWSTGCGSAAAAARLAHLDDPAACRRGASRGGRPPSRRTAGTAAGSVGEVLTTSTSPRAQEAIEIGGAGVGEPAGRSLGDEHPHVVAAATLGLHRVVGDQLRRHLDVEDALGEREGGHHATSSGVGTSDAR